MEVAGLHWYVNYPESELLLQPMYNVDFSYPAHLHGCMEVTFCVEGAVEVTLDGCCLGVKAGEGILIPPNMVHSYHTPDTSSYYTILFSRDLLPDFAGKAHCSLSRSGTAVLPDGSGSAVPEAERAFRYSLPWIQKRRAAKTGLYFHKKSAAYVLQRAKEKRTVKKCAALRTEYPGGNEWKSFYRADF